MYTSIFLGIDGSPHSDLAQEAALLLAEKEGGEACIQACHVYTTKLHRQRFVEMEPGLPDQYQDEDRLERLRGTHEDLITDGMDLISNAYLSSFVEHANARSIQHELVTAEGRNYVKMLEIIKEKNPSLVVIGAQGHGTVPEESIGSVAERILMYVPDRDILITRQPVTLKDRPIVVGIDGSQNSFSALHRAIQLAKAFETSVHAIAVYDPYFHVGVFRKIAAVLPPEDQKRFNFQAQEALHDEIIDKGLEKLYAEGLDRGKGYAEMEGVPYQAEVLTGKTFAVIDHYASEHEAGLVVLGRWGRHKEDVSLIGGTSLRVARLSSTNVLVVAPSPNPIDDIPVPRAEEPSDVTWTDEALAIIERIPEFARKMARGAIETYAKEQGQTIITAELVSAISKKMGMG
jgi:nucleotide-binding universal stress UspA family protein